MVITRDEIIATSETVLINFSYKKATNKIDHYHILHTFLLVTSLLLEIGATQNRKRHYHIVINNL